MFQNEGQCTSSCKTHIPPIYEPAAHERVGAALWHCGITCWIEGYGSSPRRVSIGRWCNMGWRDGGRNGVRIATPQRRYNCGRLRTGPKRTRSGQLRCSDVNRCMHLNIIKSIDISVVRPLECTQDVLQSWKMGAWDQPGTVRGKCLKRKSQER